MSDFFYFRKEDRKVIVTLAIIAIFCVGVMLVVNAFKSKDEPKKASALAENIMPNSINKEEAVSTRRRFLLLRRQSGERIEITETPFKVGRKRELCDYCIENNKTVSRVHVILKISENGRLTVFDNRSLNKVYVNGKRIPSLTDTPLFDGDEIRLGSERFIVTEEK